jgi:membrane protease subunit (stomatin/prohibitin family)
VGAQFLDVIQWLDNSNDTLVYRFPIHDQAITDQSKVIVREGQAAVFISQGQMSDVFAPGTYTLNTPNTPIMSFFQTIAYSFNNPFKGDILFVSTRQFTNNGWGTQNAFPLRDPELGRVQVRAFGTYAFRITDPATFIRQIVGTDGLFTTDEITGHLKKEVVQKLSSSISKSGIPVYDLVSNYGDIGQQVCEEINPEFNTELGISLTRLTIGNISLPKAIQEAIDTRTKMGILGDLNDYTKLKSAEAIETAAANPGIGGAGVGMGVGLGMGNLMAGQMAQATAAPPPAATPPPIAKLHYHGPAGQAQLTADEIAARVMADRAGSHRVWSAGWPDWKSWSDVPEVAAKVPPAAAAPPPMPPPPAAVTYHYHGDAGSGQKSLAEVVALVSASPDGKHHVWQDGWDGWKEAKSVDSIASKLSAGPPPPPGSGGGGPPAPPA